MRPWTSTQSWRKFQWPANGLWGRPISYRGAPLFLPGSSFAGFSRRAIIFFHAHQPSVVQSLLVAQQDKLLERILLGASDANIGFEELCQLLRRLGFDERTRGSHHVFRKQGVQELINLQRDGSKAKAYQVRQVRSILLKYGLGGKSDA